MKISLVFDYSVFPINIFGKYIERGLKKRQTRCRYKIKDLQHLVLSVLPSAQHEKIRIGGTGIETRKRDFSQFLRSESASLKINQVWRGA